MIEHFFSDPETMQRLQAGPLGPHMEAFAEQLLKQGYARSTGHNKIWLAGHLSRWLDRCGLRVEQLDEQRFKEFRKHLGKRLGDWSRRLGTLNVLLRQLRETGLVPTPPVENKSNIFDQIEQEFAQYLAQERGLAHATIAGALRAVRRFLHEQYGKGPADFGTLTSGDVTRFMLRYIRDRGSAPARTLASYLRGFFRFLYQRGDTASDFAAALPRIARWRLSSIPKFLEPEEVERLLDTCDRNTTTGRRDYTVLLLLARLGLRGGEVVNLMLEDIRWVSGEIVVRGKSAREDRLPLPQDVGEALATYVRHGRPQCTSRRVFIRARAPYQGFSSPVAVCDIVRRALSRAGLNPDFKGAHLLRHSLATRMLRTGKSMAEIGEILRHQLPNTTEIYAKVDLGALHALAQPWKGAKP
jgi:site-specific recombinase XerD